MSQDRQQRHTDADVRFVDMTQTLDALRATHGPDFAIAVQHASDLLMVSGLVGDLASAARVPEEQFRSIGDSVTRITTSLMQQVAASLGVLPQIDEVLEVAAEVRKRAAAAPYSRRPPEGDGGQGARL